MALINLKSASEANSPKTIESNTSFTSLREDAIIYVQCKKDSVHRYEDAVENIAIVEKLATSLPCLLLVNISSVKSMSAEARSYYSGERAGQVLHKVALVTSSVVSKVIGNFFIGLNKSQSVEARLFENEIEASAWLLNCPKPVFFKTTS